VRKIAVVLVLSLTAASSWQAVAQDSKDEKPADGWSGEGELGYVNTTGNTETQHLNAKLGLKKEVARWLHEVRFEAGNQKDGSATTAERYYAAAKSDYAFTERDYGYAGADYEDDRFSGYDYRTNVGLGYGRRVVNTETLKLNLEIGPGYRWSELDNGDEQNEATLRLAGNLGWTISDNASFTQELSAIIGDENTASRSFTALTTKINGNFALRLSYLLTHNSDPPPDTKNTDTETAVTLVYGF